MLRTRRILLHLLFMPLLVSAAGAFVSPSVRAAATAAAAAENHGRLTARDENAVQRARANQSAKEAGPYPETHPAPVPAAAAETRNAAGQLQNTRGPEPALLRELKSEALRSGVPAADHLKVIVGIGLLLVAGYGFVRWLSRER